MNDALHFVWGFLFGFGVSTGGVLIVLAWNTGSLRGPSR